MEKNAKTVASATKTATANAASSAAKTATPTAETKQATPAKAETKTAEPAAETKPAAVKTETPQAAPATSATPAAPAPQGSGNGAQIPAAAEEVDRKQSFAEMQRKINEELERLSHKKEVADKRDVFLMCGGKIDEYLKKKRSA